MGGELRIDCTYDPRNIPAQQAFRSSQATIRGYGGAMGGGKSRSLCELAFDWMLEYPGILLPIIRQVHTHIVDTTRKTFIEQVLPSELRGRDDLVKIRKSGGFDFVKLWNGSEVQFIGLDNPGKLFSSELGGAMFDEAHEIKEEDVMTVNTRLRQRCRDCIDRGVADCQHMPHKMVLCFNPSFPGHWLQQWFVLGANSTEWGYHKDALITTDAEEPIGSAEFFIARATDNPFLPPDYVTRNLGGLSVAKRRRYLDGFWEHISGSGFFDQDALSSLLEANADYKPLFHGEPVGDPSGTNQDAKPTIKERGNGRMEVFKAPIRKTFSEDGDENPEHRYIVAVDASSGASSDFSAIQVFDIDEFEQVAEWQGKVDPDQLATVAFLTAVVYNGATLAPEITGGWGFAVVKRAQQMCAGWKGPPHIKPKLYTRPVTDRLSNKFTDLLGWDTNTKSRAHMLTVLEEALRDGSVTVHGARTMAELGAFVYREPKKDTNDYLPPRARSGHHDDLVIALAIAVAIAAMRPKSVRRRIVEDYDPVFSAAGF